MVERGLPIPDGAPACPFVAFEDDRDARATAPDHRHRCYAEARPAPRATAHQEAYCLSSAFPVCPTFQDWARREAAAARPSAPAVPPATGPVQAPASRPLPPPDLEPRHAPEDVPPPPFLAAPRNPPRRWTDPPPWLTGEADAPADRPDWGPGSRGLAGSAADRLASGPPAGDEAAPPAVPPPAGPAAARSAGPGRHEPPRHETPPPSLAPRRLEPEDEDAEERGAWDEPAPPRRRILGEREDRRAPREEPAELFGPAWELARRDEAYPALRRGVALPGLGPVALGTLGLAVAAALLFFLGPVLLGVGGDGPAATPTATASAAPSASEGPVITPAPTAQVHVVARGETLSKIAAAYGLSLEAILAANPQITNPDRIKEGDPITIPPPLPTEVPGEVPGEVPTEVGGSTAP